MKTLFLYLRYSVEFFITALVAIVVLTLPFPWSSALGGFLARTLGPLLPVNKVALVNLSIAFPKMELTEKWDIVKGMWDNLGRNIFEYGRLVHQKISDHEVVGLQHLEAVKASGKPCLFITAHLSNWEIGCYFAQLSGIPVAQVSRDPNNPWVCWLMRKIHGQTSPITIPKGTQGAKQIIHYLRSGVSVSIMVDQKLNEGIDVPFFGHEAMTASAVARLAMTFECPIIPIQVERLKGAQFRVTYHTPMYVEKSADKDTTAFDTMKTINGILEDWITQHPDQWFWVHRRWPKSLYKSPKGA